jgi:type II secretory pathway component PulM
MTRTLEPRETKALIALGVTVVLVAIVLVYEFWPASSTVVADASPQSVQQAEQRLARVREIAASVPGKQDILKKVAADLETREKGLIRADTAQQAQAQVITILRGLGASEAVDIRATELGAIAPFSDDYGAVNVSIQVECRIEQLLNFLAALAARPELIATRDLRVIAADPKQKTLNVRITVAGIVPKNLVPQQKKGA